ESPNLSMALADYSNEEGEHITLVVYVSVESMSFSVIMEEGDVEKQVLVRGKTADLYLSGTGDTSFLTWTDDEEHLLFVLSGPFTEEEAVRIAESIRLMPPHRPGWVPEGYTLQGMSMGTDIELRYGRETGEELRFCYWGGRPDNGLPESVLEELEGAEARSVLVDGLPGEVYLGADGTNQLFWSKGEDRYWISGPVSQEELIEIAGSIGKTR
ncbi:MAG: DUF4367 domain-containing protein, partial [Dysosmobacter sp.]|nr:DUF4367 domain-containing protein [Dysosmobacter sp.]